MVLIAHIPENSGGRLIIFKEHLQLFSTTAG